MFVLIWATLLFSMIDTDASVGQTTVAGLNTTTEETGTQNVTYRTENSSVKEGETTVESTSSSGVREERNNCTIKNNVGDLLKNFFTAFYEHPQVIIAFLIGILLTATICCLTRKCHRKKPKSSGNVIETLEMATTEAGPLIDAADQSATGIDMEPKEVEYSDIDFHLLNRKSPTGANDTQETTETEYAEIKNKEMERQDNGGEGGEMLEGNEEEVMIGEDKETQECMSAEKQGGGDVMVYSNVKEIMGED
ncbi:hypothetical protein PFLUV_G00088560 [Perca fluviatilis]|uniref:Uncharacterized protein n=1 Tax=Perca fluviatilis TaxID=8168 RepID=A0A6A5EGC2_PERFL|nr:uncharacterized protein LOC120562554 [Perca fluviatilis]KAF1388281.1 hypothetical protein PFLUV_G00088560 [Perca fluviatilis]